MAHPLRKERGTVLIQVAVALVYCIGFADGVRLGEEDIDVIEAASGANSAEKKSLPPTTYSVPIVAGDESQSGGVTIRILTHPQAGQKVAVVDKCAEKKSAVVGAKAVRERQALDNVWVVADKAAADRVPEVEKTIEQQMRAVKFAADPAGLRKLAAAAASPAAPAALASALTAAADKLAAQNVLAGLAAAAPAAPAALAPALAAAAPAADKLAADTALAAKEASEDFEKAKKAEHIADLNAFAYKLASADHKVAAAKVVKIACPPTAVATVTPRVVAVVHAPSTAVTTECPPPIVDVHPTVADPPSCTSFEGLEASANEEMKKIEASAHEQIEKIQAEATAAEKTAAEKAEAEKQSAEKAAAEKHAAETAAAFKTAAEQAAVHEAAARGK